MILAVHQPQYIPWLGYFDKIKKSDCFVFLDLVQYKPREYQNRNKIRTKDGWIWLTVPVVTRGLRYQKICDVIIDNELDWQKRHWGSLYSYYGKSPFFKEYSKFFQDAYSVKWERLLGLNMHIIRFLVEKLGIKTPLLMESEIGTTQQGTERIIEICRKLNADTYLSGIGGKAYLQEEKLAEAGIRLIYQDFAHPQYRQQYLSESSPFLPYMSAIDLLFNEGEKSARILREPERCMRITGD
jgi:hypothetical protein